MSGDGPQQCVAANRTRGIPITRPVIDAGARSCLRRLCSWPHITDARENMEQPVGDKAPEYFAADKSVKHLVPQIESPFVAKEHAKLHGQVDRNDGNDFRFRQNVIQVLLDHHEVVSN